MSIKSNPMASAPQGTENINDLIKRKAEIENQMDELYRQIRDREDKIAKLVREVARHGADLGKAQIKLQRLKKKIKKS